jgi:signal transduction histidine kinase
MTLRHKTLLIIGLIFAALVLLLSVLTRTLLLNSFDELQTQDTHANLQRALNSLAREVEAFESSTNDYAVWDDTLDFVQNGTPTYIEENLSSSTFASFQINYIVFANPDGQVVFSQGISDESEIPVPPDVLAYISQTPLLYQFASVDDRVSGFIVLPENVAIIASAPIRTSANTEPIGGALIWIRLLDTAEIARLAERTQLSIDLHAMNDAQLPSDFPNAIANLNNNPTFIQPLADNRSAGYTLLNDIEGNPSLILRVDTPRSIFQQGQQSTLFFVVVLVILGVAAVAAALILVERLVLARLAKFSSDVQRISQAGLSERVSVAGDDELAAVEAEVNKLLAKIETAQEELRAAKDAAEQSNRAKSIFLANMSHELRTPLNAIMGFLTIILMNAKLDSKDEYRAQRAYANSERLLNTINDILDISRIEAGRLQIVPMPISVRDTVESVRSQMEVLAEEKSLPIEAQVTENVPSMIETDGDALTKIITNLLSNGIKFTETGSVKLLVDSVDNRLIIKVTDTGIGIAPHMYDLIFESFRQVDESTTRPYGGIGLGLAIVQNLCKAMQGNVRVESELGRGSTFTVTLPFAQVKEIA